MGIAYNPRVVTDGLVLCLDAANKRSYPGTGTTWTDLMGENDGTLDNGPTFGSDNGGSIVFDGSDDKVSFNLTSDFSGITLNNFDCTQEGWCRFEGSDINQFGAIVAFGSFDLEIAPTATTGSTNDVGAWVNNAALSTTYTATLNVWHHYSLTKLGNVYTLYVDGQAMGSDTDADNVTVGTTGTIGNNGGTGGSPSFLQGSIALVKLYNRALTADEVRQNYNANRGRFQ